MNNFLENVLWTNSKKNSALEFERSEFVSRSTVVGRARIFFLDIFREISGKTEGNKRKLTFSSLSVFFEKKNLHPTRVFRWKS